MKKLALLSLIAILATSCTAQEGNQNDKAQNDGSRDIVTPKGNWTVNKELDEHGNIIRYDSIYSYSSSGNDLRELHGIDPDSLLQEMRAQMRSSFGMMGEDPFAGFFGNDSTGMDFPFGKDPFLEDFFSNRDGFPDMEAIRKRMEAMQQLFFQREEQPWIPAVPEENQQKGEKYQKQRTI